MYEVFLKGSDRPKAEELFFKRVHSGAHSLGIALTLGQGFSHWGPCFRDLFPGYTPPPLVAHSLTLDCALGTCGPGILHPNNNWSSLQGLWVAFFPGLFFWGWAIPLLCTIIMGQRGGYFEACGWSLTLLTFQISTCELRSSRDLGIRYMWESKGRAVPFGKPNIRVIEKVFRGQKSSVGVAFTCISWAVKLTENNKALEWLLRHRSRQCA